MELQGTSKTTPRILVKAAEYLLEAKWDNQMG
jgi:hypothetical protein